VKITVRGAKFTKKSPKNSFATADHTTFAVHKNSVGPFWAILQA